MLTFDSLVVIEKKSPASTRLWPDGSAIVMVAFGVQDADRKYRMKEVGCVVRPRGGNLL